MHVFNNVLTILMRVVVRMRFSDYLCSVLDTGCVGAHRNCALHVVSVNHTFLAFLTLPYGLVTRSLVCDLFLLGKLKIRVSKSAGIFQIHRQGSVIEMMRNEDSKRILAKRIIQGMRICDPHLRRINK